jgi:hypothetical protein
MIRNTSEAIGKLVKRLGPAPRCGSATRQARVAYRMDRRLTSLGATCTVAAPSRVPGKPERPIKMDHRDAIKLARLLRSSDLTPVWVPDEAYEDATSGRMEVHYALRPAGRTRVARSRHLPTSPHCAAGCVHPVTRVSHRPGNSAMPQAQMPETRTKWTFRRPTPSAVVDATDHQRGAGFFVRSDGTHEVLRWEVGT